MVRRLPSLGLHELPGGRAKLIKGHLCSKEAWLEGTHSFFSVFTNLLMHLSEGSPVNTAEPCNEHKYLRVRLLSCDSRVVLQETDLWGVTPDGSALFHTPLSAR